MAEKLPMLALSPTMENGVIVKWHYNEGDAVSEGDVLCEVETDKAVMDYTSNVEGTLLKILLPEGQEAGVGDPICIVGEAGEDISNMATAAAPAKISKAAAESQTSPATSGKQPQATVSTPAAPVRAPGEKLRSTPIARRLADKHGLNLSKLAGTGPGGRITKRDVENAMQSTARQIASAPGKALDDQDLEAVMMPISSKRRIIAQRLTESKYTSPHFYMKISAIMDELLRARQELNRRSDHRVSFNAFLIKFVATSLKRHPMVNSSWIEENIIKHGRIDIGLAVALEDGLITPIVRDCSHKGILQIDEELKDLIERARNDRLKPEEFQNSTFTISNLGTFGIEEFSAIINPPNAAILAVGKVTKTPLVDETTEEIVIRSTMTLSLSCDHRVIDGTVGAAFLTDLKEMLEYPVQSLY